MAAYFIPQQKRHYKINVPIEAIEDSITHSLQVGYHNPGSGSAEQPSQELGRRSFNL